MSLLKRAFLPLVAVLAAGTFGAIYAEEEGGAGEKPKAEKPHAAKGERVNGVIGAVDAAANTVEIKAVGKDGKEGESVKLTVNADTKITGADKKAIAIGDLKAEDKVSAMFNADKVALTIMVKGADAGHEKKKKAE